MSKTLSNILTVFKVAKVIAKVAYILTIIGAVGCLIGALVSPMLYDFMPELSEDLDISWLYSAYISGTVACIGATVLLILSEKYFKNVLNAGTPFTFEGAKECFRLGIASLIISVAVSIISGIAVGVALLLSGIESLDSDFSMSVSLSSGLFYIFLSMIFKYGAELQKDADDKAAQDEQEFQIENL
ncbi:MAG: hypothetical protein E7679_05645 [Ruminococcaceae bacterium]|nr:hypothetical protein [Oscillospiraceae bacterium]